MIHDFRARSVSGVAPNSARPRAMSENPADGPSRGSSSPENSPQVVAWETPAGE
jgi:hypothetical protein